MEFENILRLIWLSCYAGDLAPPIKDPEKLFSFS
jgi:hypothetical protein